MAATLHAGEGPKPKSMTRPKVWNDEVEDAYRFQLAGYKDELEYRAFHNVVEVERWPETGYVKKLQRKDGCFYYFNKLRECSDKDINKTKLYAY